MFGLLTGIVPCFGLLIHLVLYVVQQFAANGPHNTNTAFVCHIFRELPGRLMQTLTNRGGVRKKRWENKEVSPKCYGPTWWCCGGNSAVLAAAVAIWVAYGHGVLLLSECKHKPQSHSFT